LPAALEQARILDALHRAAHEGIRPALFFHGDSQRL
jgi:hypothetical protein